MGGRYAYAGDNPVNRVDPSGKAWLNGHSIEGGDGGQGCTMTMYSVDRCASLLASIGVIGSNPAVWSDLGSYWDRCSSEFVMFVASVALAILGMAIDPLSVAADVLGETSARDLLGLASNLGTGTGLSQDLYGIFTDRGNVFESIGSFLDIAWFILTSIIIPTLDWWGAFVVVSEESAHFTPLGLAVYTAYAVASSVIAFAGLASKGCA